MALSNWSTEQYEQNDTPLNNICHSKMITVKSPEKATGYYQLISERLISALLSDGFKGFQLIHQ